MAAIFLFYVCAFGLYVSVEARCYRMAASAPEVREDILRLQNNEVKPNNEINYDKPYQFFQGNRNLHYAMGRVGDGPAVTPATAYQRRLDYVPQWSQLDNKESDRTLHERTGPALRTEGALRTESRDEAVAEDFDLLLEKMQVDKTRMTTASTTTHVSKVLNIIDETEVRSALREDSLIKRVLAHAKAKRQAFFKQMEENGMMAYDSFQRRYPVYK